MKPEATTIYVVLSRIVYILREFSVRGIRVKTFKFEEMGSDKIQARMNISQESKIFHLIVGLRCTREVKKFPLLKYFRWAPICTTIWYWSSYRKGKLRCRGKLPTRIISASNFCASPTFSLQRDNNHRTVLLLDCPFVAHFASTTYPDDCL